MQSDQIHLSSATKARLVLGSAQWGLKYGRANSTGKPKLESVRKILELCLASSSDKFTIDTAQAYGEAEAVIGQLLSADTDFRDRFDIITKLSPLPNLSSNTEVKTAQAMARESVEASLKNLGVNHLPVVLLHRWSHRAALGGAVWELLRGEVKSGRIGKLGVSVQSVQELMEALAEPAIEHIQLPFHLLDGRWHAAPETIKLIESRKANDVSFHARSPYLQGILLADSSVWPVVTGIDTIRIIEQLDTLVQELGRADRADLCIAYVRSYPWVGGIVVGMETSAQCEENLKYFANLPLSTEQRELVRARISCTEEKLLNPALWK